MLAVRDQENLAHAHQTAAAGKSLNQGTKQFQPKTPFKVPLNDENDPLAFGKKTVKGGAGKLNENAKPGKDAFVTPLGMQSMCHERTNVLGRELTKTWIADTRQRAPLGMKTTNAKARGNQTPAPGTLKPERTNKRTSNQKVKKFAPLVQQNETEGVEKSVQDDIPDIEYMPPKPQGEKNWACI